MTRERHAEILSKLNSIRDDMQTRQDGDCRTAVYTLCEIVGQLLCELKNVNDSALRAGRTASMIANGMQPD